MEDTVMTSKWALSTAVMAGVFSVVTIAAAQNGRYTFTGTANDELALVLMSVATSPAGG